MKYGLFRYSYARREGYWVDEVNIGDYVQSIAARQFLPQVDALVERDTIAEYQGEPLRVIMNGWWHLYKGNAVPAPNIEPLYVSIHIANPQEVPPETFEHFKRHQPIGCRDYATTNFLKAHGIDAYFSGCMTLTLGRTYAVKPEERDNNIYFVNFDRNILVNYVKSKIFRSVELVPSNVRRRLHETIHTCFPDFARCPKIYRNHFLPLSLSEDDRFRTADSFLRDYAKARLVITTKIHCALPCAGMGTPVILMMQNSNDPRFGGIKELLNHFGADTSGEVIQHLFLPDGKTLGGSPEISGIAEALAKRCTEFVQR